MSKFKAIAVMLALGLALLSQGCGQRGITCPEIPQTPPCSNPTVSITADKHRILSGEQVEVRVSSTGADTLRVLIETNGVDSLLVTTTDANFTFYYLGPGNRLGINTLKVTGNVNNGDCTSDAVFSLLIVPNCAQFCDEEGTLRRDDPIWKGCYTIPGEEGPLTVHAFVLVGRHSSDTSRPDTVKIAAGLQGSTPDQPNNFFWFRAQGGEAVRTLTIEPGYTKQWFDLEILQVPGDREYGPLLAHPSWNGLGNDALPDYTTNSVFYGFASWPF